MRFMTIKTINFLYQPYDFLNIYKPIVIKDYSFGYTDMRTKKWVILPRHRTCVGFFGKFSVIPHTVYFTNFDTYRPSVPQGTIQN